MNLEHRIFNQIIRRQLLKEILIEEIPKNESVIGLGLEQIENQVSEPVIKGDDVVPPEE